MKKRIFALIVSLGFLLFRGSMPETRFQGRCTAVRLNLILISEFLILRAPDIAAGITSSMVGILFKEIERLRRSRLGVPEGYEFHNPSTWKKLSRNAELQKPGNFQRRAFDRKLQAARSPYEKFVHRGKVKPVLFASDFEKHDSESDKSDDEQSEIDGLDLTHTAQEPIQDKEKGKGPVDKYDDKQAEEEDLDLTHTQQEPVPDKGKGKAAIDEDDQVDQDEAFTDSELTGLEQFRATTVNGTSLPIDQIRREIEFITAQADQLAAESGGNPSVLQMCDSVRPLGDISLLSLEYSDSEFARKINDFSESIINLAKIFD